MTDLEWLLSAIARGIPDHGIEQCADGIYLEFKVDPARLLGELQEDLHHLLEPEWIIPPAQARPPILVLAVEANGQALGAPGQANDRWPARGPSVFDPDQRGQRLDERPHPVAEELASPQLRAQPLDRRLDG